MAGYSAFDSQQGQKLLSIAATLDMGPPIFYKLRNRGSSAGFEAHHLPPLIAKGRNAWNSASLSYIFMTSCLVKLNGAASVV